MKIDCQLDYRNILINQAQPVGREDVGHFSQSVPDCLDLARKSNRKWN